MLPGRHYPKSIAVLLQLMRSSVFRCFLGGLVGEEDVLVSRAARIGVDYWVVGKGS